MEYRDQHLPGGPVRLVGEGPLVVFLHGSGEDHACVTSPRVAPLTGLLLEEGFAVAAPTAYGASWGNPFAMHALRRLTRSVGQPVAAIGESMGAFVGLRAIGKRVLPVVPFVGIAPVTDLAAITFPDLRKSIRRAWLGRPPRLNAAEMGSAEILLMHSSEDEFAPFIATERFAAASGAQIVETAGAHWESIRPEAVVEFVKARRAG